MGFHQDLWLQTKGSFCFNQTMGQMHQVLESSSEELLGVLDRAVLENPFLYWKRGKSARFIDKMAWHVPSFYEHLAAQIEEEFSLEERALALEILYDLDERGYYKPAGSLTPQVKKVRQKLLLLDPVGTGSISLQECLLTQLRHRRKTGTLSYYVLSHHFQDFLHQRFALLSRKLHCSSIFLEKEIKKNVQGLYTRPRSFFDPTRRVVIVPDILVHKQSIQVDPHIPSLWVSLPEKIDRLSRAWSKEAAYLESYLHKRSTLLTEVMGYILARQKGFFFHDLPLASLEVKEAAASLQIHPATFRRVIGRKYVSFDGEVFPMSYFFSRETKGVSQKKVAHLIGQIVTQEPKEKPLSDEEISERLAKKGCYLSRRTVAKYRARLGIPKQIQRRREKAIEKGEQIY
ncbi:MAG: hypothetical protein AAGI90_05180 [Chlamydiota bacterium]